MVLTGHWLGDLVCSSMQHLWAANSQTLPFLRFVVVVECECNLERLGWCNQNRNMPVMSELIPFLCLFITNRWHKWHENLSNLVTVLLNGFPAYFPSFPCTAFSISCNSSACWVLLRQAFVLYYMSLWSALLDAGTNKRRTFYRRFANLSHAIRALLLA